MTEIIHFANATFGRAFIRRYRELPAGSRRSLRVTLVFSGKKTGKARLKVLSGVRDVLRFVLLSLQYRRPGIRVLLVENVNDERFRSCIPAGAIGFCTGFNQIFGADLLRRLHPFVNVHPSVLPYYRGPVPSHWCLRQGESRSGYTFHRVTGRIDAGEILYQGVVEVGHVRSTALLDEKIAAQASIVFASILESILEKKAWPDYHKEDADKVYAVKTGYRSFE